MKLDEEIKNCYSLSQFCRLLGFHVNGTGMRKAKKIISDNNLDISHFDGNLQSKIKYEKIKKECPVCGKLFETQRRGDSREKTTCSHSCSNSYFRSGNKNGNWKDDRYRTTCFLYHKKECVVCGEDKIVEVHHMDENRNNNNPMNLIPLCPTHHQYWHSRYKKEIEDKIYNYIKKLKL
jgi:hypothetical protein